MRSIKFSVTSLCRIALVLVFVLTGARSSNAQGGIFNPGGPGTPVVGACCLPTGACITTTSQQCTQIGGTYSGDNTVCSLILCAPAQTGACCLPNSPGSTLGSCVVTTQALCNQHGGTYQGNGVTCGRTTCPTPTLGACCMPQGHCFVTSQAQCASAGGSYQGNASMCSAALCPVPPRGACCLANGHCLVMPATRCQQMNGAYQGDGTTCGTFGPAGGPLGGPCPTPVSGACCLPNGHCSVMTSAQCTQLGGNYQGNATVCASSTCPTTPTGACCRPTGQCAIDTAVHCQQIGGTYNGDGSVCTTILCPGGNVGACCLPNGCGIRTQAECAQLGGTYQGNGTSCATSAGTTPCPTVQVGGCCLPSPTTTGRGCTVTSQAQCTQLGGTYQGNGTHCGSPGSGGPCPQPQIGACCLPTGGCVMSTQAHCTQLGGTYNGNGSICTAFPGGTSTCPQPQVGACCIPNSTTASGCTVTSQAHCTQLGGTYQGNGTNCGTLTTPGPCPQPQVGACCLPSPTPAGGHCQVTSQANCAQLGGTYQGNGTNCGTSTTPRTLPATGDGSLLPHEHGRRLRRDVAVGVHANGRDLLGQRHELRTPRCAGAVPAAASRSVLRAARTARHSSVHDHDAGAVHADRRNVPRHRHELRNSHFPDVPDSDNGSVLCPELARRRPQSLRRHLAGTVHAVGRHLQRQRDAVRLGVVPVTTAS